MKLHLPKEFLKAVLSVMAAFVSFTVQAADTISINFTNGTTGQIPGDATGIDGTLESIDASGWKNINAIDQTNTSITNQTGEAAGTITIANVANSWTSTVNVGTTLDSYIQKGYIDTPNHQERIYTVAVDHGYWVSDVVFYMSADTASNQYSSLNVNGTSYYGSENGAVVGNQAWGATGDPAGVTSYDYNNSFKVTGLIGDLVVKNDYSEGDGNSKPRATLAGLQIIDKTAETVYFTTLGTGETSLVDTTWSLNGGDAAAYNAETMNYLGVNAAAEGSTLVLDSAEEIDLLGIKTGALTLTANANTTLGSVFIEAGAGLEINTAENITVSMGGFSCYDTSTLTKSGAGTLTVATDSYGGDIEVSEGTLKFDGNAASSTNNSNREIAVQDGATLDINGKARHYEVVLNQGATLTNTGAGTGSEQRQLHTITLNGDATVSGTGNFYLLNNGHSTTFLNLNQNTLTKSGSNTFYLRNTTVQSAGVIRVEGGTVETSSSDAGTLDISKASLEIANGGSFVLAGKNQQIQNLSLEAGGSLTVNSGLTLTAQGAVAMSGGTVSGNLCLMGAVTFEGNVDLGSATVTAQGPVIMNGGSISGNLSLAGAITLAGDVDLSGATLSGTSLAGFKMLETAKPASSGLNSLSYQLWEGTGNVTTNQESIVVGGETYAFNSSAGTFSTAGTVYYVVAGDTVATGEATAGATSFVVDGTLNVTADTSATAITASTGTVNIESAATLSLTEAQVSSIGKLDASAAIINLAAGSTLNLGQSGADAQETTSSIGTVNVAESAATIHLTEKATLNPLTKTGNGTITLTGNGIYKLAEHYQAPETEYAYMPAGVSLSAEAWRGTVQVSNSHIMGVNLDNLGNAHSYVKLNGLGAWMNTSDTTINTNLILENYSDQRSAFIITDSSNEKEYIFNGSVSGTGDFQLSSRAGSSTESASTSTYTFNGDTSQWSGGIIIRPVYQGAPYNDSDTASSSYTVNLSGGGNVFAEGADGVTQDGGGTLTLVIGKAGVKSFMNGAISRNTSTLNLTAQGDTKFNKSVSASSLTLGENACVTLGGVSHTIDSLVARANSELILSDGADVTFGASENATMTTAALKNLQLEGATVTWQSSNSTIQKLSVKKDSSWTIKDMSADATLTFNTVSVDENVKLTVNKEEVESWNQKLHIGNLTGAGDVDISGPRSSEGTTSSLAIDSLAGFRGNLTVTSHESDAKQVYNATVNTGSEGAVSMGVLKFVGFGEAGESSRAVFNVQNNTTVDTISVSEGGTTTINIEETGTLHAFTKEGSGTITLTGSGTYDLGSNTSTNVSGLTAEDWTGTVTLSAIPAAAGLNMNTFGNADSKVKLNGVSGWFARAKFNPHIVLGDNGLTFTAYSDDYVYNFANGISGKGNFVVKAKDNTVAATPFIAICSNSDTSLKWSGKFKVDDVHSTVTLLLNGGGTYFDADSDAGIEMNDNDNTLSLYVGYATAPDTNGISKNISGYDTTGATLTTINGTISNNKAGTLELTVLNNTEFNKNVTVTSMTVNSGKTATLTGDANSLKAGDATITSKAETDAALSNVTVQAGSISAASTANSAKGSITDADVQIAQLAQDASFTIEDMTLTNTTITATTPTTQVNLQNVTASNVVLKQGKFSTDADMGVTVGMGGSGSSLVFEGGLAENESITIKASEGASLAVDLGDLSCVTSMGPGKYDLSIALSGVTLDAYTDLADGAGITFAGWLGELIGASSGVQVSFSEAVAEETPAAAAEGGAATGVTYSTGSVGTVINIYGLNVPEPATSTLSLLALAALAARRRRKA